MTCLRQINQRRKILKKDDAALGELSEIMELWKASEAAKKEVNKAARKEKQEQLAFELEQRDLDRERVEKYSLRYYSLH